MSEDTINKDHAPRTALIVAHTFAPSSLIGTMRTLRMVRRLHARNWNVSVLTALPSTYGPQTPVDPNLLRRVPAGVGILHAPVVRGLTWLTAPMKRRRRPAGDAQPAARNGQPPAASRSVIRRAYDFVDEVTSIPDKEAGWIVPALLRGLWHLRSARADVIYSSAPPWTGQMVALGLARLTGLPWVADFRDPWARAPWKEAQPERIRRAVARLEPHVVARADRILFVSRTNRDEYVSHYGDALAAKSHLVPNGCDPDEFVNLPEPPRNSRFVLLHAGTLYGGRTPVPLFRGIASAIQHGVLDRDGFRLRLIGSTGNAMEDLPAAAASLGLKDVVEFVPRLPRAETLREMAAASCLLVLQPGTTVAVPGKLYEYMAVGRPILGLTEDGETADLVRGSGLGTVVDPRDEQGIEAALVELASAGANQRPPRPPANLYDGNLLADCAISLMEQLVATGGRR